MKKSLFFVAAAALALTACSSDNEATQSAPQLQSGPQAVAFDTYVPNTTRAGAAGVMTTSALQTTGFGVFAQYSNNTTYSKTTDPTANFMYNQQVTYTSAAWGYTPLKYWPNETTNDSQGGTDGNATSAATDVLSFFAYAPYVSAGSSGGIEGMMANDSKTVDPWVSYSVATTPENSVDLVWGVAPSGGLSYTDVSGGTTTVVAGKPLLNLVKPKKDEKIKFLFQHALARLGLTVVAAFDQIAPGGEQPATTKIAVKSVVITETTNDGALPPVPTPQLKTSGKLNLNNTTAFQSLWYDTSGTISFTVSGATLNSDIAWDTDAATTYSGVAGVTTTEKKVIAQTGSPAHDNYFMVIPSHADTQLQVVITYDVITADANLSSGYSVVENVITKKVTIPALTNNKAYNLKLVLGMTSVKLDAEVAEWKTDGGTETYLPQNVE